MSLPQALEEALFESLSAGTFADVKFYAFSQRTTSGRVRRPKSLYANSHVLQTVPYFRSLLSDGFSEGKLRDLRCFFPPDQPAELDGHDFLDDSDLEDIEDDAKLAMNTPELQKSPVKGPVFGSGFASAFSLQFTSFGNTGGTGSQSTDPGAHLGKVVVLRDIAFVTLRAVLFFLYTGEITFTPPNPTAKGPYKSTDMKEFSASAKSVYLAADKYDIPELKELALKRIRSTIHSCDIVQELASDFTARFPELRKICLEQLANALCASDRADTSKNLISTIQGSIRGDSELVIDPETRGAIFDMLAKGYTPTNPVSYVASIPNRPPNWSNLCKALRKSLISGDFLDGHIKAYRGKRKDRKLTRPSSIYFSTTSIPSDTMSKIYHKSMTCTPSECEYDSDSDLEDDKDEPSEEVRPEDAGSVGKVDIQQVTIMKYGSWKTWRAALFFMYSHKIAFAPIRSQNIAESDSSELPPVNSCSPRSVFVLAEKIGVQRLQDQAREDLLKKVTRENIMTEYFSKFVDSHTPLLHTIDGIVWQTRNAEVDAVVRKKLVEPTVDGPHNLAALELFLQHLIEENDVRIVGHCQSCHRGYTEPWQPKEQWCPGCGVQRRVRAR